MGIKIRKFLSLVLILIMICSIFAGCSNNSVANAWLVGKVKPTNNTKGNDGDLYLDEVSYNLYQKENDSWILIGNIKGEEGDKGKDGKDGFSPTAEISEDGYWIINGKKTNTRAEGRDGKDGISPLISISEDGYWVINGKKTAVPAKAQDGSKGNDGKDGKDGKDGVIPTIEFSEDGYWIINGVKTKIKAKGEDGVTPTIAISEDGYWIINGVKTKIKAICENCIHQNENLEDNAQYKSIDNYVHYVDNKKIELHNIQSGKCTKCGETNVNKNNNYKFVLVETTQQLEKEIIDLSNNGIYIKPGTYNLTKGIVFYNTNETNIVGLGNNNDEVIINVGSVVVDPSTCQYVIDKSTAPLVFVSSDTTFIKFNNLTIENTTNSTAYIMSLPKGWLTLENVAVLNNSTKPAINSTRYGGVVNPVVIDIVSSQIKNLNAGTSTSPNKYAPIQIRKGVTLNVSKNSYIYTQQVKAPSISIDYGSSDTNGVNTINIDNTITSKHGDVEGIVIYSATPNDKWTDIINVNGVQLKHNDDTSKGGKSTISSWNVYDANDWDIIILDYDGYLYTNNQNLKPSDYLSLLG